MNTVKTVVSLATTISLITLPLQDVTANQSFNIPLIIAQSSRSEVVDDWTDYFFYGVRPEMKGRRISSSQTLYAREWSALRQVVNQYVAWTQTNCGEPPQYATYGYDLTDLPLSDELADAVFYGRHPELNGRTIRSGETALAREWRAIHSKIADIMPLDLC